MTTIAWRLAHLIVGFAEMNGTHFDGPPTHIATFNYVGTAKEALPQPDDAHDMWVKGVRSLGDAELARPHAAQAAALSMRAIRRLSTRKRLGLHQRHSGAGRFAIVRSPALTSTWILSRPAMARSYSPGASSNS